MLLLASPNPSSQDKVLVESMTATGTPSLTDDRVSSLFCKQGIKDEKSYTVDQEELLFYFDKILVEECRHVLAHLGSLGVEDTNPNQGTAKVNPSANDNTQACLLKAYVED